MNILSLTVRKHRQATSDYLAAAQSSFGLVVVKLSRHFTCIQYEGSHTKICIYQSLKCSACINSQPFSTKPVLGNFGCPRSKSLIASSNRTARYPRLLSMRLNPLRRIASLSSPKVRNRVRSYQNDDQNPLDSDSGWILKVRFHYSVIIAVGR